MIYKEKKPLLIEAYKFTGEVTDELKKYNIIPPNPFQENNKCPNCGRSLRNHGLFGIGNQFQVICPNNYIIVRKDGSIQIMSIENFESIYTPLNIEDAVFSEKESR